MRVSRMPLEPGFRLWPYPRQYGYCRSFSTESEARTRAIGSRDAFIPLIAATSFFLHTLEQLEKSWPHIIASDHLTALPPSNPSMRREVDTAFSTLNWEKRLREETRISTEWISYFLVILGQPVVGGFIDVQTFPGWLTYIPVYSLARMPLALCWGPVDKWLVSFPSPIRAPYDWVMPQDVRNLSARQAPYIISPGDSDDKAHSFHPVHSRLRLPPLNIGLRQGPHETLTAFLERRERYSLKLIAAETADECQSRLDREANARKGSPPGWTGARVFYWELINGERVRIPQGRNDFQSLWERYSSDQRRYDSVTDEWDICTDLDPDEVTGDNDFGSYNSEHSLPLIHEEDFQADHSQEGFSSVNYLDRLHHREKAEHGTLSFKEEIHDLVRHRFGYIAPSVRDITGRPVASSKASTEILSYVGWARLPGSSPSHDATAGPHLEIFLRDLLKAEELKCTPSSYDLVSGTDGRYRPNIRFNV
ncbi:hypothetical protein BT96DRAFT_714653 [Gymnopus androsaceus JB14]|uniref:Uncharacterized protein n=1 Tax=Gymnopus androsaceus JB14 TaxID=1447944 RepID=A0A6A4HJA0_9AGAR|nr:hypothetical protein BT96DRAFT_714653 [Gymnopus androsaceus JB14]